MTIGGAARTRAMSVAMVVGLVLSIVLYIFSVAPLEEQFSQRMDSAREEATQQDENDSAATDD